MIFETHSWFDAARFCNRNQIPFDLIDKINIRKYQVPMKGFTMAVSANEKLDQYDVIEELLNRNQVPTYIIEPIGPVDLNQAGRVGVLAKSVTKAQDDAAMLRVTCRSLQNAWGSLVTSTITDLESAIQGMEHMPVLTSQTTRLRRVLEMYKTAKTLNLVPETLTGEKS